MPIVADALANKRWLVCGTSSKSYMVLSQMDIPALQEGHNFALRMDASGVQAVVLDALPS